MRMSCLALSFFLALMLVLTGCAKKEAPRVMVLKGYPLDHPKGLLTQSDEQIAVSVDREVFAEGEGSLRITKIETSTEPATIRLFETGDVDVEEARLIYEAKLRTEGVEGKVYLEMWCHFPGGGEYFSRGLETPLTGTVDWTTTETPFLLKEGENPDNIRLNLVFDGTGTAWIDDIRLQRTPLQ